MKPPAIPAYLKEKDWTSNVAPAVKNKWPSASGITNVTGCLKSLSASLSDLLKSHAPDEASSLANVCSTLDANLKKLQGSLSKEKENATAATIKKHTEFMQKDIAKLKSDWNNYTASWRISDVTARPGMKKAFFEFSKKEYAEEGIMFLTEAVKVGADPKKLYELYEKFIRDGARYQINIPATTKKKWEQSDAHKTIVAFVKPGKGSDTVDKSQAQAAAKELLRVKEKACKDIHALLEGDTMGRFKQACQI